MNMVGITTPMLATAVLLASANIFAMEPLPLQATPSPSATEAGCHSLMTEKECVAFRSALAGLPMGKTRDRFMAEHTALMRERESLCSCNRANADTVILYPHVKQVAQRS